MSHARLQLYSIREWLIQAINVFNAAPTISLESRRRVKGGLRRNNSQLSSTSREIGKTNAAWNYAAHAFRADIAHSVSRIRYTG